MEREWEAEKVEEEPGSIEEQRARYLRLGTRKWYEFIDGKDHGYGSTVYDTGANHRPPNPDPGYLDSMKVADRHVHDHLGAPMNVVEYARIHDRAMRHSNKWFGAGFRDANDDIGVPTKRTASYDPRAIEEMGSDPTVDISGPTDEHGLYRATHRKMPTDEILTRIQTIFERYYAGIGTAENREAKVGLIADTHQRLERLHAFIDGTGRTDHFVLNKFLVENGLSPAILEDQNEVNHSTRATWATTIENGMESWTRTAGGDVPTYLKETARLSAGRPPFAMGDEDEDSGGAVTAATRWQAARSSTPSLAVPTAARTAPSLVVPTAAQTGPPSLQGAITAFLKTSPLDASQLLAALRSGQALPGLGDATGWADYLEENPQQFMG